jgi:tRNA modification GTPase
VTRAAALAQVPIIAVATKCDMRSEHDAGFSAALAARFDSLGLRPGAAGAVVGVSAATGVGLPELIDRMGLVLAASSGEAAGDVPLLLRARHERAVREAKAEMDHFAGALESGSLPMSVAATHLRAAAHALESLIGVIGVDDVLDRVFSSFCVGK